MKKAILGLLLTTIIFTFGCTKTADPQPPQTNFTATITYDDEKYSVTHNGKSITSITITKPTDLNGLTYNYKGSELTLNYKSLSYTPSASSLPVANSVTILHNLLCELSSESFATKFSVKSTDSDITVYESETAEITCETTTGNINQIRLKNNGKSYKFSNYS